MTKHIDQIDKNFLLHATRVPETTNGMKVMHRKSLSYVDSGLSCDTFNIIHIHKGTGDHHSDIKEALEYFGDRQLDYCLWINKQNLTAGIKAHFQDFSLREQNMEVGMSLDLGAYQPITSERHEKIIAVSNQEQLEDYASVIAANWSPPDKNVNLYYERTLNHYLDSSNGIILLTYYEDGIPKSTVEMFPTDEATIGLYGLATLEDARGQGIGSAMMTKALNIAKDLKYETAVLQATEDGLGIYKKFGFVPYTKYYEFS